MQTIKDELDGIIELQNSFPFGPGYFANPNQYRLHERDTKKGTISDIQIGDKIRFSRTCIRIGYLFGAHLFSDEEVYAMCRDIMMSDTRLDASIFEVLERKYQAYKLYACVKNRAINSLIREYRGKYFNLHKEDDKGLTKWRMFGRSMWFVDCLTCTCPEVEAKVIGKVGRWTGLYEPGYSWGDGDYDPPVLYKQEYQQLLVVDYWNSRYSNSMVYPDDAIRSTK